MLIRTGGWGFLCAGLLIGLLVGFLCTPAKLFAHSGPPVTPAELNRAWHWEPALLFGLALPLVIYVRGAWRVWRRAGVGHGVTARHAVAYGVGLAALFAALVSPLHALSDVLFSAHMLQHMLLIMVAAPLLAGGAPAIAYAWALPTATLRRVARWRRDQRRLAQFWRWLRWPPVVWLLYTAVLTLWHLPNLYQAAVQNEWLHGLEHLTFLGSALFFWNRVFHWGRGSGAGVGILVVFTAGIYGGGLAALLSFSPTPWYPYYALFTSAWGLTPLADQQLAGVIMWVPGNFVHLLAGAGLILAWLRAGEDPRAGWGEQTLALPD